MKAMSVILMLAALGGVIGDARAQTGTAPANQPSQAQVQAPAVAGGSFVDECGFRYNSRGDRIDARGRVLPAPVSSSAGRPCR